MDTNLKREIILDNYNNPQNRGLPEDEAYIKVNSRNESCVDNITVGAKLVDNKIEDVKFDGEACPVSTSATSILLNIIKGKTIAEVKYILENYK